MQLVSATPASGPVRRVGLPAMGMGCAMTSCPRG